MRAVPMFSAQKMYIVDTRPIVVSMMVLRTPHLIFRRGVEFCVSVIRISLFGASVVLIVVPYMCITKGVQQCKGNQSIPAA